MVKDDKLRKDLEDLFKQRGNMSKSSSKGNISSNGFHSTKTPKQKKTFSMEKENKSAEKVKGPWKNGLNSAKTGHENSNGSIDSKVKDFQKGPSKAKSSSPNSTRQENDSSNPNIPLKNGSNKNRISFIQDKSETKPKKRKLEERCTSNSIKKDTNKEASQTKPQAASKSSPEKRKNAKSNKSAEKKSNAKSSQPKPQAASKSSSKKRKIGKGNEPAKKKSKVNKDQKVVKKAHILENGEPSSESEDFEYEAYSNSTSGSEEGSDLYDTSDLENQSSDDYSSDEYSFPPTDESSDNSSYEDDSSEEFECHDDYEESSCSDPDYTLPQDEVEDLIIHKGLATTYKLESHHGVEFDEAEDANRIIELPGQTSIKTVIQHNAYKIENLLKQEDIFIERQSVSKLKSKEECPQLVPIENQDNFKLWTSGITIDDEMFSDDELEEISDESSVISHSDVNRKYTKQGSESNESTSSDDEIDDFGLERMESTTKDVEKNANHVANPVQNSIFNTEVETETSLADVVSASNTSLDASNVEIIKADIDNFDEEYEEKTEEPLNGETSKTSNENSDYDTAQILNAAATQYDSASGMDEDMQEYEEQLFQEDSTKKQRILTKFYNSIDSYYVLALLKSPIFIYGTIKVQLIAGSTEIYGYELEKREMVALHSPRGCSVVPLRPTTSSTTEVETPSVADFEALSDEAEFSRRDLKELISNFDATHDAIVLLKRNEAATKIKNIFHKHINENIYPTQIPKSRPFYHTEAMLDCMVNATTAYALQIPQQWHELSFQSSSKFMLIGGKSVGKSTLLRYLINKNLNEYPKILLIDLDIGQPEIFVPQTVSCALIEQPLLGPGLFCETQPSKAYAVGHTNLILCAHAYMRAVLSLLKFCRTETAYSNVPWIINTMGYNKGFGAELISVICAHLQPTDIVQLQSNKPINNFDILFDPSVVASINRNIYNAAEYDASTQNQLNHTLHVIPSAVVQQSRYKQEWQMSPKDMRYIMLLARLSSILPDEGEWINQSDTFKKSLENLHVINLTARNADKMETLKSLECNLVYLCNITESTANEDAVLECLGIGIVRGIDFHAKQVYIMPAMPVSKLKNVNCLALGEMPLPGSLLTEQDPEAQHNIPFVQVMQDEATSRAVKQFFYRS